MPITRTTAAGATARWSARLAGLVLLCQALVTGADEAQWQACRNVLSDTSLGWVNERLDRADQALARGQIDLAAQHYNEAALRFPRNADVPISPRCLGPALYRRIFEGRRSVARALAARAEAAGESRDHVASAAEAYLRAGDVAEVRRILDQSSDPLEVAVRLMPLLERLLERPSTDLSVGGSLPPFGFEERATLTREAQALREELEARLDVAVRQLLQQESRGWHGRVTIRELEAVRKRWSGDVLDVFERSRWPAPASLERLVAVRRAERSLATLAEGAQMAAHQGRRNSVTRRAESRGDQLLAWAEDEATVGALHDVLYRGAQRFFQLAGNVEKLQRAEASRAAAKRRAAAVADDSDQRFVFPIIPES